MINRCAITVRKQAPFLAWLRNLPDSSPTILTREDKDENSTVYLVQEYDFDAEREQMIAHFCPFIFEHELHAWWTAEVDWPQNLTFSPFKEWFDYEFHSVVQDLVDEALEDDNLML